MLSSRNSSLFVAALSLACAAQQAAAVSVSPIAQPVPKVVSGATVVSHVTSSKVLNLTFCLMPNRTALRAYAASVNNPKSPNYHHFLSPTQVGQRFGASTTTINTLVSYLKSKGLTVTLTANSHMAVLCKGTVNNIEGALSTKINNYHVASRSTTGPLNFYSNATVPKLPSSVSSQIVAIGNLNNANPPVPMTTFLTPGQSRGLYQGQPLYNAGNKGEGVTVAISNLGSGYSLSNVPLFYSAFNLPAPTGGVGSNITKIKVGTVDGETSTDNLGESDLDIQMALGEAPHCRLLIYDGFDVDALAVITREYNDDMADVLSESWGEGGDDATLEASADVHASMAISGMTYLASSGDSGTNEGGFYYPHGDPNVLAIGGSDATVSDANGTRVTELGWDGSGSGYNPDTSLSFNVRPDYQVGNGVPSATNYPYRLYPDVALHATGSQLFISGQQTAVGGTSASSPQFAGLLALMLQDLKANDAADSYVGPAGNHYRLGQINAFIYGLNGDPASFYDITTGDTGALPNGQEATGATGWDFVTGWGAPIMTGLDSALLANASIAVSDTATSANVTTIPSPVLTLGTVVGGDVTSLPSTDGVSYVVQSVKENGLGQVAASTVSIPLQTSKTRRAATLNVAMQVPAKATGYVYLLRAGLDASNPANYDLVSTIAGTGAMTSTNVTLDVSSNAYITGASSTGTGGTVTAILRSIVPTRLGSAPFQMSLDQVSVTERVARG